MSGSQLTVDQWAPMSYLRCLLARDIGQLAVKYQLFIGQLCAGYFLIMNYPHIGVIYSWTIKQYAN